MGYNFKKHADTLELFRVLDLLKAEASISASKEKISAIEPAFYLNKVQMLLNDTEAAYVLMGRFSAPTFGNTPDTTSALNRADVGAVLSVKELIDIAEVLRVIRSVKQWRDNCDNTVESCIDRFFVSVYPNNFLEDKINSVIKSEDEIYDNASPALYDIRRKISNKSSKIREILDKTVKGPLSKYLQDAIITQRDGRFVVPVRLEYKSEISGIVHDTSSSGQTLFIEPMSVVEANNDIRVLKSKEADEINRILSELSVLVSEFSDSIRTSYKALVDLDVIFAKAKLAYKMNAVVPVVNNEGRVDLKRARHPLIDKNTVVPIDISLGKEYRSLVITGPNTGGKTVAIKTVGLITLMAMCGLMIPAADNSEIAIFNKIFADIGDEQSIENNLSTFSSHMKNIISIIEECDDNSLALMDELCAGTDPVEGAALAKAILMNLSTIGACSVVTTHYPELKIYALDTQGVQNASCEFDVKTLKPTYRIIFGMPGRSNAFEISKRLGLPDDIIELAKIQLNDEDSRFERVVSNLESARRSAEEREKKAAELKTELEKIKKRSDDMLEKAYKERESILEKTRVQAVNIINNARYRSGSILNELEEIKHSFSRENADDNLSKARKLYKSSLDKLEDDSDVVTGTSVGEKLSKLPEINDTVIIASLGSEATVLSVDTAKNKAFVVAGALKMWVDISDLTKKNKEKEKPSKKARTVSGITSKGDRKVSAELDIRGFASDEGILELDRFIDEAVLSGLGTITIIHGKGTGVLRKAVHSHLRKHKNIKGFRVGSFGEGENGVTIAEIN